MLAVTHLLFKVGFDYAAYLALEHSTHRASLALLHAGLLFHSYYVGIISLAWGMASSSSPTSDIISIQLPAISGYPSLGHTSAWREEFPPSQGCLPTSLHYYQYTILDTQI